MHSRKTPPDSLSASDSTGTDDPTSATTGTSTRRGALRLLGADAIAGIAGCLGDDEEQIDNGFPEGVRFEDDWRIYAHGNANTAFLRDRTVIPEPTIEYEPSLGVGSTEPIAADGVARTPSDPIQTFDSAVGEELWTAQGEEWTAPVVLDGTIYSPDVTVHDPNRLALCRARAGRLFRTIGLPDRPWTPPAFSNDRETLFLGLDDECVCTVDINATEIEWTRSLFGAIRRPLTVNLHSIFVVTEDQQLYCPGTDGHTRWQTPTETVEAVAPVAGDERVYIAGWDRIAALERRSGDMVWEDNRDVRECLAFGGDRFYVVRGSFRALDSATGEERWHYDPEETVSATNVVGDMVYVDMGHGNFVALNRTGDGGLFGDRERWSISLSRNVGRSLAATDRRVLRPLARDDSLPGITVVTGTDGSGTGTTTGAGGSES